VARRGQVVHLETVGYQDIAHQTPLQSDTIFRIYSMTKPIASVALMMLYEEGLFQLSDSVAQYIPEFKGVKVCVKPTFVGLELTDPQREMTIHDLLVHTSGLSYGFFEDSPVEALYRELDLNRLDLPLAEAIHHLAKIPLLYQPGTAWRYSVSTDVVGHLVELISGQSLDLFFKERIF
jgi:CubicO group peptidase (beta-lactamase class C family)